MTRQLPAVPDRSSARAAGSATKERAGRWALGALLLLVAQACDCNCAGEVPTNDGGPDKPTCVAGTEGCPCDEGTCGDDLLCSDGECVACPFGTEGCPCEEGTCGAGDVCDQTDGTCRQPTACEQAGCAQYQLCEQNAGEDALCLKECEDGYRFVQDTSTCVAIPSCDADDPGFVDCGARECEVAEDAVTCGACRDGFVEVGDECVENGCSLACPGRECTEDSGADGGPPVCGGCLPGYILDASNDTCVDLVTCDEANCGAGEFCIEAQLPASNAECRQEAQCPTGQVDDGTGTCVACVACFNGTTPLEGVAGIANAGYAWGGKCVCDLEPGYFQEIEGGAVKACDADGDGWVNASLELTRQFQGGANPFNDNHQCTVRKIDRFELWSDDYLPAIGTDVRQARVVTIEELVDKHGLSGVPTDGAGVPYVELLEPSSLDELNAFTERYTTAQSAVDGLLHNYGGHSDTLPDAGPGEDDLPAHRLVAAEANPLTKMCNHDDDDLNWDGVPDVEQSHDFVNAAQLRRDTGVATQVFYRMSYFIELNRGYYSPAAGAGELGKYVIAEKSRLLGPDDPAGLELTYPEDGLTNYWQICARGRSPDYNMGLNDQPPDWNVNNDFAGWYEECASDVDGVSSGTCEVPDGNGRNHIPYDGRTLRSEGVNLAAGADLLSSGEPRWPGMNHSSQFKCVSFAGTIDPPSSADHRRPPADFQNGGGKSYFLENCRLEPRTQDAPPAGADGTNPADPGFSCEALDPDVATDALAVGALTARPSQNFFVALEPQLRTSGSDDYRGGCIDEGVEWQHLCLVQSEPTHGQYFGELFCSCGPSRAGPQCEHGCPDRYLFSDREGNPDTFALQGYWVCMVPTASDGTVLGTPGPDAGYTLRGHVPAEVTPTEVLCEEGADGGCAPTGYRIGPWTP